MCPWNTTHGSTTSKYSAHKITLELGRKELKPFKTCSVQAGSSAPLPLLLVPTACLSSNSPHRLSPKPDTHLSWSSDPVLSHLHTPGLLRESQVHQKPGTFPDHLLLNSCCSNRYSSKLQDKRGWIQLKTLQAVEISKCWPSNENSRHNESKTT